MEKFEQIVAAYPDIDYAGFRYKIDNNLARFLGYKNSNPLFVERLKNLGVDLEAIDVDGRTVLPDHKTCALNLNSKNKSN